ncbi:hypothetical protein CMV_003532 [Castanea mollissima]|uniref:Uncharacterized protein n=1 Tax=Castanea mollissima TaxID=60419 RepID=A0A8J4RT75_9ROSI|nr:hypothetical protein CMV_003532 [Castanea mollissima]
MIYMSKEGLGVCNNFDEGISLCAVGSPSFRMLDTTAAKPLLCFLCPLPIPFLEIGLPDTVLERCAYILPRVSLEMSIINSVVLWFLKLPSSLTSHLAISPLFNYCFAVVDDHT